MIKYLSINPRKYFFIIFTTIIFFSTPCSKSFSEENVFVVDNIEINGPVDLNFSREKYINKAFLDSFKVLVSRILLLKDLNKINNTKLNKIKELIASFQILEENYQSNEYKAIFKVFYSEKKVKKFLGRKNISFSQPKSISVVFFPALFINGEMQDFSENFFYKKWTAIKINNELINFVLPLEDLDDILKIKEMKNKIEELNPQDFVNKYNIKNYVFAFIDNQKDKMNIHLKTNFNNSMMSKNISYKITNINDESEMTFLLKDLKMKITDIWKEENIINLSMPLSIKIKFKHNNIKNLNKLKNNLYKINIIENFSLSELDVNNSFLKIYYYGNPRILKADLLKFGYKLRNDQGYWEIYIND